MQPIRPAPRPVVLLTAALAGLLLATAGCSGVPFVYRLDVQQGNVVTQEMLDQLEPGMDRRKVLFILGTPLITDPFHAERWDYHYSFKEGGGERVQRHVSIYFDNDRLVRVEGDVKPAGAIQAATRKHETIVTVPAERKREGIFARLIPDILKSDKRPRRAPPPQTPASDAPTASEESQPLSRGRADGG